MQHEPLETPGDYWRVYGNRVLLVIIVILAVFLAVRYYRDKQTSDTNEVSLALENARSKMSELQQILLSAGQSSTPDNIQARERIVSQLGDSINSILTVSKEPKIIARGYLYKGDMKWELANAPDPSGATTRPELKVQNRTGLLNDAQEAYSHVLESPYSDDAMNVFSARMGLAAIAENNHKWADAKTQYQAVVDSTMPSSFKELARKRLVELPGLEQTPVLNAAPDMTDLASMIANLSKTQPASTQPVVTPASTQPATTLPDTSIPMTMPGFPAHSTQPATSQPATTQSAQSNNVDGSFFLVAKTRDLGNAVFNVPATSPSLEPFSHQ